MTIPDLIKDFIDASKERLKTPISGAFLWSFIIYNWRPIFLLMFSNKSIEDKITVINNEYCNLLAIIVPILMAIFYTKTIPWIMLQIDNDLLETKLKRIDNIYDSRSHTMDRKINIAKLDFKLKNAESGNREIEDYLEQIESLKNSNKGLQDSIKNINEANNNTINELNNQFTMLEAENSKLKHRLKYNSLRVNILSETLHLDQKLVDHTVIVADTLTFTEYMFLWRQKMTENNMVKYTTDKAEMVHELANKGVFIIDPASSSVQFTEIGDLLCKIIQTV
ncbi:hypothetical protein [Flavobacterium sp. LC2016-01]|uniref:hypothetical protein n=1 Tax=Flavobacterium sp. LC2016-01 TaxID=2675876 RepID=UPI0012BADDAA|nr:hypothetical protein [Flavobacterium sp. LC2016-01]MTH14478.1 hypothetical protein [Flavobacterium sp. LC2016-01]